MSVDFFENGLCFCCHLAKNELQAYADFHARTEHAWEREDVLLQQEIDALLKKYPDADQEDIVDTYAWDMHLNQYKYPDIHRSALIISLYVFLEDQLTGICTTLGGSMETQVRLADLSGQGVERAFSYLSKVAQFDLGRVSRLPFVKGVNRLRNKMVHAGGVLPCDANDKLNKFVRSTLGLRGGPGERVHVEPGFIDRLIEELTVFFDELDAEVQLFMKRAQQDSEPAGSPATTPRVDFSVEDEPTRKLTLAKGRNGSKADITEQSHLTPAGPPATPASPDDSHQTTD